MPALLAATVQDSKAQRQERLKTRFRDRGGCVLFASLLSRVLRRQFDLLIHQHQLASSSPQR